MDAVTAVLNTEHIHDCSSMRSFPLLACESSSISPWTKFSLCALYVTPGLHTDNVASSRWIVTSALATCSACRQFASDQL